MNSQIIDIIFVVFLIIMAIFGYIKGFVTRLYDFAGMIIVLFLSYFLAKPLSSIFMLYKYDSHDVIASTIGQLINQIIVFVGLIVVLTIIKKLLGIAIKPMLKGLMDTFSLTAFADKVLGVILSLAEGACIAYLVLVFIVVPFAHNGTQMINDSLLAKKVVYSVPQVSEQIIDLTAGFQNLEQIDSKESLTKALLAAMDMGLIDKQQAQQVFTDQIEKYIGKEDLTLSSQQIQKIKDLLLENGYNQDKIESILSNINVSGE